MSQGTLHSVLQRNSDAREVLERVTSKWAVLVLYALDGKTTRFGDLQREVEGISQKMLATTLRMLEQEGLVSRTVYAVVPPKVEYALTPLGHTLTGPLRALCHWAEEHLDEVRSARDQQSTG